MAHSEASRTRAWWVGLPFAAILLATGPAARGAETRADVETDHLDAADDGGPRSVAILVRPLALALWSLGGEVDVALGEHEALSVEASAFTEGPTFACAVSFGVPLFLQHFVFRGFYVHPRGRVAWVARTPGADGGGGEALGLGALVGYEWTWLVGATLRLGGGAMVDRSVGARAYPDGPHLELDAALGWTF